VPADPAAALVWLVAGTMKAHVLLVVDDQLGQGGVAKDVARSCTLLRSAAEADQLYAMSFH
jgi:hypothetical protein